MNPSPPLEGQRAHVTLESLRTDLCGRRMARRELKRGDIRWYRFDQFDVTREQIAAVLGVVAQSLKTSAPEQPAASVG